VAYDNTNRGVLFRNEKREGKEDSDPDYSGQVDVAGTEYWLSAWIKQGKSGKFMSLSVRPKQEKPKERAPADAGDDIPF
jgi:hypothetical protein